MVKGEVEICFDPRQKASSRRAPRDGRSDLELEMVNASAPPILCVFHTNMLHTTDSADTCLLIANTRTSSVPRQGAIGWQQSADVRRLCRSTVQVVLHLQASKPPPTLTTTAPPRHRLTRPDQQNTIVLCPDQHSRHLQGYNLPCSRPYINRSITRRISS